MPYLKPKMDEYERAALLKLLNNYAEASSDSGKSVEIFLEIQGFIDGLMEEVYHFNEG